jgi:glycosyltransferase involved in cell wall biosynthesis
MSNKKLIGINGKFFGATGTGVQRVAEEMIIALDELLTHQDNNVAQMDVAIIAPTNVNIHLNLKTIKKNNLGILSGFFKNIPWEQINLPFITQGRTILSLCNVAPMFLRNAVVMIHDAQVYITPESYSFGFKCWYKLTLPMIGKFAKKIITVSEFSKTKLVQYGVAKAEKIVVIHNGCDHVLKTESDESILDKADLRNKQYCIAQANTQTHKNIAVLLEAFADEALKNVTLVLYGGTTKQQFENKGMVVPNNVVFTGRVTDGELKALITNALATLTPSLTEGFGLQPLEGMALGTPAIIAPCGALPEVCGDAALYANQYEPSAWVKAIIYLAENPKFSDALRKKVKAQAEEFTWEKSATKLVKLLKYC